MIENPFEDPDVAELMAQHGIVHKPGMAQEMLEELAPLLEAEGVDLDNLEFDSIEELNAVLGRAVEQRNLQLMTPVSAERDLTLDFLLEVTELLAAGNLREAERAVRSIEPEPTATRPPASHVIGESFGLLDTWHSDANLGQTLADTQIPKWRGPAKSTARRLLIDARRGEAYDSMDSLLLQHGGEFVMHSSILAVAGTIITHAANEGSAIPEAATELFQHSGTPAAPGSAFGMQTTSRSTAREAYHAWLEADSPHDPDQVEEKMEVFAALEHIAGMEHLDIDDPDAISHLLDVISELPDDTVELLVTNLDTYVRFRADTEAEESALDWEAAHWDVIEVMDELFPEYAVLTNSFAATHELAEAERRAALLGTRALSGAQALLEWNCESRPVTHTGNLRRADLAPAAKFFGLYVEGVAKLPPPDASTRGARRGEHPDTPLHVQSMFHVPVLASLWEAMQISEVLTVTSTRARPGPAHDEFFGAGSEADALERFASVLIMEILLRTLQDDGSRPALVNFTLARLIDALDPEQPPLADPDSHLAGNFLEREICLAGFIAVDEDGQIEVPVALKASVAGAVLMTIGVLERQ